ncbi:hypothetical protein GQ57_20405 [Burkholderia sp. MSh2]|uniref:Amine oxidase n=1 Tax=Burkholderia paludis TaxID=1506587 RepID=A0A6J5DFG6_9BURK|nr:MULTISPECIES: FAD-dependent oxidoreductase [Burkholderia]KEZ04055.1 hypothetical protein GQ57_20405 [Burkholderia sp. MSh2]CAB3752948.1 Putative flavin-containing monoamine oxidase AofH [Burkholderia paludis]VWB64512.1 amine oxidase [Burkholderia paludis]
MTGTERVDVCIIGAGLAGLRAAQLLGERGHSVCLLEARDRVGGRTHGGTLCGKPVDLGGQWLGAGQTRAVALCRELDLELYEQYVEGRRVLDIGGKVRSYTGSIPPMSIMGLLDADRAMRRVNRNAKTIDPQAPWKAADAARWDRMTLDQWMEQSMFTRSGRSLMKIMTRALCTSEPHEVSFLGLLNFVAAGGTIQTLVEMRGDGAQRFKVHGGAFQLAERLADALLPGVLKLNAPVHAVEQSETGVTIRHAQGDVRASRLIVAIPPLLAARIDFTTPLPAMRMQLHARMPMGSVIKALIAYERPFWRERGWSGEAVSDVAPFGPVADATPPGSEQGFLVGFFAAGAGREHAPATSDERRQVAVRTLQRFFGPAALSPVGYVDKDWISDPWSQGGYVGVMAPGTLTAQGPALREPCGRIHWAGTESATRWAGYMEGAIESGERAVTEVVERGVHASPR